MLALLLSLVLAVPSIFGMAACSPGIVISDPVVAYAASLVDAEVVMPSEISRNLAAVVPYNSNLVWQNGPGSRVLVASLIDSDTYYKGWEGKDDYKLGVTLWVTLVPELKNFFRDKTFSAMRLKQLMGLPPYGVFTKVVEVWADPKDLVRPSPDPEITDHEAELDFPQNPVRLFGSEFVIADDFDRDAAGKKKLVSYQTWFTSRKANIYKGPNGYPWTRLGYTYDWGDPNNHVGASEFLLCGGGKEPITVGINSITDLALYFAR